MDSHDRKDSVGQGEAAYIRIPRCLRSGPSSRKRAALTHGHPNARLPIVKHMDHPLVEKQEHAGEKEAHPSGGRDAMKCGEGGRRTQDDVDLDEPFQQS